MEKDEFFLKRIRELANLSYQRDIVTFSDFLNLNEQNMVNSLKSQLPGIVMESSGGYDNAERQMVAFHPDALAFTWEYPIDCLKIEPKSLKFSEELTHRDYLGAVMNLGIERYLIGDILVDEKCAYIFCMSHIMDLLKEQLGQVRHTRVAVEEVVWEETGYIQKYKRKGGFVASMRLDVLVSQAYGLSRTSSDKLLKAQKVFHNGRLCISSGQKIRQGDIISVRGYGKFLVEDLGKTSKKGRQFLTLAIFQ